jgi:hypothetical protein
MLAGWWHPACTFFRFAEPIVTTSSLAAMPEQCADEEADCRRDMALPQLPDCAAQVVTASQNGLPGRFASSAVTLVQ